MYPVGIMIDKLFITERFQVCLGFKEALKIAVTLF